MMVVERKLAGRADCVLSVCARTTRRYWHFYLERARYVCIAAVNIYDCENSYFPKLAIEPMNFVFSGLNVKPAIYLFIMIMILKLLEKVFSI